MPIKKRVLGAKRKKVPTSDEQRKEFNFNDDGTPISGEMAIQRVREETDTVLMSYSLGKDSLAMYLKIKDRFPNIVPYYLWSIPNLGFVEESLQYFEEIMGCHIIRLPHPRFWRFMNVFLWQPQERCLVIEAAGIPQYDFDDLTKVLIDKWELPKETFVATGVRAADSPMRRSACNQYGPINWKRRNFWPIWDMYKDELVESIKKSGIKLPVDYELFGRSFDGLDYRFLAPIREYYPEDFELILEWLPMARFEIMRYEEME